MNGGPLGKHFNQAQLRGATPRALTFQTPAVSSVADRWSTTPLAITTGKLSGRWSSNSGCQDRTDHVIAYETI
jgi:hypothetical protein